MNKRGLLKLLLLAVFLFLVLSGFIVYNNIKKKVVNTLNGEVDVEEYKQAIKEIADGVIETSEQEIPIEEEVIEVKPLNSSLNETIPISNISNIANSTNTNT